MLRRIQLSAALAVGGLAIVAACSKSPREDVSAGDVFGPAVALAEEPRPKLATKHQNYSESLDGPEGKVSFDMIAVPGGEFEMGSPKADADRKEDEGPQVKVRLKPF